MRKTPLSYGVPAVYDEEGYFSQFKEIKHKIRIMYIYIPGPSISAYIVEKSSSFTPTLIPSGGVSSRFLNSLANCFITFGGRFSLVACKM